MANRSFRYFSLSFQSAFHRSITLLVRYRTCRNIRSWRGCTRWLELQYQEARLIEHRRWIAIKTPDTDGAITLVCSPFQAHLAPMSDTIPFDVCTQNHDEQKSPVITI